MSNMITMIFVFSAKGPHILMELYSVRCTIGSLSLLWSRISFQTRQTDYFCPHLFHAKDLQKLLGFVSNYCFKSISHSSNCHFVMPFELRKPEAHDLVLFFKVQINTWHCILIFRNNLWEDNIAEKKKSKRQRMIEEKFNFGEKTRKRERIREEK